MKNYLYYISESRYKTHGLNTIERTLPKTLKSMNCDFIIEYYWEVDDFSIEFTNLTNNAKDVLIGRCELIGYYPSVMEVNDINIRDKNIKTIDDFVTFVKDYDLPKENCVFFHFESWLDQEIDTPETLYHICRTIDKDKILRYGISPKSKHKISYHPDRIYITDDYKSAIFIMKQFKEIHNTDYSIVTIKPNSDMLVRRDPNFEEGYYTNQNISPNCITDITDL